MFGITTPKLSWSAQINAHNFHSKTLHGESWNKITHRVGGCECIEMFLQAGYTDVKTVWNIEWT